LLLLRVLKSTIQYKHFGAGRFVTMICKPVSKKPFDVENFINMHMGG
jgi:hypothetical protein